MTAKKSTALATINTKALTENADALNTGMDAMLSYVKTKKGFKDTLKNADRMAVLIESLTTFVAVDQSFENGATGIGRVIKAALEQPYNEQVAFIEALCKAQGLEPLKDKDGKVQDGRKGFVHALFGRYPDAFKASGKDTVAGKRLSYYLYAADHPGARYYRTAISEGTTPPLLPANTPPAAPSTPPAATGTTSAPAPDADRHVTEASKLWRKLYDVCHAIDIGKPQPQAVMFLMQITAKAGVKYEDWLPSDVVVSTDNPKSGA